MLEACWLGEKEHHLAYTTGSMVAAGVAGVLLGHPSMGCSASGRSEGPQAGQKRSKHDRYMWILLEVKQHAHQKIR